MQSFLIKSPKKMTESFEESCAQLNIQYDQIYQTKNTMRRDGCFSEKFFEKQLQNNTNGREKEQSDLMQRILKDKKSLLSQAIDLLYESNVIFKFLKIKLTNKSKKCLEYYQRKLYINSLLCLIVLVKCQLQLKNREGVIQELLIYIKQKISKYLKHQLFSRIQFLYILRQKYYNANAQFFQQKNNPYKALSSYLKALNFRWNLPPRYIAYDSTEALKSIQSINKIIEEKQISLTKMQKQLLIEDIAILAEKSSQNHADELYFFEVFFSEEKEFHKRNSIYKKSNKLPH